MDKKSSNDVFLDAKESSTQSNSHHPTKPLQHGIGGRRKTRHRKRISFQEDVDDDVLKLQEAPRERPRKSSVAPPPVDKRPEWYEDLTEEQINMFKTIFEMLDSDGGGSIDATELYSVLRDLDTEVSLEEIKSVLGDLDKDGNGEIDFDEFLYAMAETKHLMEMGSGIDKDSGSYSKRQTLFFTAITRFAIKNSLGEIERYYAHKQRQAPHVISCYTAGVRLIGLNDRQLEQEIRRIQKANRNNKSPYAKPLPFVLPKRKNPNKKKRRVAKRKSRPRLSASGKAKQPHSPPPSPPPAPLHQAVETPPAVKLSTIQSVEFPQVRMRSSRRGDNNLQETVSQPEIPSRTMVRSAESRRSAITPEELEVIKLLHELAETGSVLARLPGIHLVPQIRNKLVSGNVQPICSSVRKKRRTLHELWSAQRAQSIVGGQSGRRTDRTPSELKNIMSSIDHIIRILPAGRRNKSRGQRGWVVPPIERGQVPLPVIKLSDGNVERKFTIEDVNDIRKWVSEAMDEYYSTLRKAHVLTAHRHWDELHTDQIKSTRLRERFRTVYLAYSPHDEEEMFAISPWIPGRWYFKHKSSVSATVQEHRIGSCYSTPQYRTQRNKSAPPRVHSRASMTSSPVARAASVIKNTPAGKSTPTGRTTPTGTNTTSKSTPSGGIIPIGRKTATTSMPSGGIVPSGRNTPTKNKSSAGIVPTVIRSSSAGDNPIVNSRPSSRMAVRI